MDNIYLSPAYFELGVLPAVERGWKCSIGVGVKAQDAGVLEKYQAALKLAYAQLKN